MKLLAPKYFYFSIYILSTQPVSSFVSLVTHSLCAASELDIARSVGVASKLSYAASRGLQVTSETKDSTGCGSMRES